MTLLEMAVEYRKSSESLTIQIRKVSGEMKREVDTFRLQRLKSQRQELYNIRQDCRDIADYLEGYYKHERRAEFIQSGVFAGRYCKGRKTASVELRCTGLDGKAAVLSDGVFRREELCTDCEGK